MSGRHYFIKRQYVLFALMLSVVFSSCIKQKIYFVRHAEKQQSSIEDPFLSEAGNRRALVLRDSMLNKSIAKIYSSQYIRTQRTVEPLAKVLNIEIKVIPANQQDALISELKYYFGHKSILVVAHSNTIPALIKQLSGIEIPMIHDFDYDDIFELSIEKKWIFNKKTHLNIINYGAQTN